MIIPSFSRWSHKAGALFIYKRIYWGGVKWTPFVRMFWRYCKDDQHLAWNPSDYNVAGVPDEGRPLTSDDRALLESICDTLMIVAGERGKSEGAKECLQRIIAERDLAEGTLKDRGWMKGEGCDGPVWIPPLGPVPSFVTQVRRGP